MNELALFAGAGGGILGGQLLGWRTVCAVESDPYAAGVLLARQNDQTFEPFPVWDDVRGFDGKPWRGIVDVVSGGFPCQDISLAGKGAGIEGQRSGLWSEFARIIGEVRPRYAFVENSPALTSRGLGVVLGDLAALGFAAEWGVLGAHNVQAPHKRDRIWILGADTQCVQLRNESRRRRRSSWKGSPQSSNDGGAKHLAHADSPRRQEQRRSVPNGAKHHAIECGGWWSSEPDVGRVAHGVANRVHRLKAIGNGQVPSVAAIAWRLLRERLEDG